MTNSVKRSESTKTSLMVRLSIRMLGEKDLKKNAKKRSGSVKNSANFARSGALLIWALVGTLRKREQVHQKRNKNQTKKTKSCRKNRKRAPLRLHQSAARKSGEILHRVHHLLYHRVLHRILLRHRVHLRQVRPPTRRLHLRRRRLRHHRPVTPNRRIMRIRNVGVGRISERSHLRIRITANRRMNRIRTRRDRILTKTKIEAKKII